MAFGTPASNATHGNTTGASHNLTVASVTAGRILLVTGYATRGSSTNPTDISFNDTTGGITWTPVFAAQPVSEGTSRKKMQWWWAVSDGASHSITLSSTSAGDVGGGCIDFSIGSGMVPDFSNQGWDWVVGGGNSSVGDPTVTLGTTPGASDLGINVMAANGGAVPTNITGTTRVFGTAVNTRALAVAYDTSSPATTLSFASASFPAAILAYAALVETSSGGTTYNESVTETASTSDTETSTLTTANALTESVAATTAETSLATFPNALTETTTSSTAETSQHLGYDQFDNGSGSAPGGWTIRHASTGVTWTEPASPQVARSVVTVNDRHEISLDRLGSNRDIEAMSALTVTSWSSTTDTLVAGLWLRGSGSAGSETGYSAYLYNSSTNVKQVRILKYAAGTGTSLGMTGTALWAVGTKERMRFRAIDSGSDVLLKVKVWDDGTAEPSSWTLELTDSGAAPGTAGWAGLSSRAVATTDYDWFSFATDGATAPDPSGTTYNDSLTETVTTSETFASQATFPNALTESATTSDTVTSTATFPNTALETAATSDTFASAATFPNALSESAATGDTFTSQLNPGGTTYNESVTETAATSDTVTSTLTAVNSVSDVIATGDIYVGAGGSVPTPPSSGATGGGAPFKRGGRGRGSAKVEEIDERIVRKAYRKALGLVDEEGVETAAEMAAESIPGLTDPEEEELAEIVEMLLHLEPYL